MTWKYTDEYYKQYTRDTWNESAAAYGPVLRNSNLYNPPLMKAAAPKAGHHVLDIATGPGEPAITLGRIVGPQGKVVGIDLSENMVKVAQQNAKHAAVANVEFRVMDAEKLEFPDNAFDAVVCRFGLQIVTDPERVIAESYRVLKPGGRLAGCVWSSPGEKTWAIHAIVQPMLEFAEPDETGYIPTPYEMGGPGELAALYAKAAFKTVTEERRAYEWFFHSTEEYFAACLEGTPIGHSLREEDASVQKQVLEKTKKNLERFTFGGAVVLPAEAVYVTGVK